MFRSILTDKDEARVADQNEQRSLRSEAQENLSLAIGKEAIDAIERAKTSAKNLAVTDNMPKKAVDAITASAIGTILGNKALERN